jgi:hypothetical protein
LQEKVAVNTNVVTRTENVGIDVCHSWIRNKESRERRSDHLRGAQKNKKNKKKKKKTRTVVLRTYQLPKR